MNHSSKSEEDAAKLELLELESSDLAALYGNDAVYLYSDLEYLS
jgi:hypothetical protein